MKNNRVTNLRKEEEKTEFFSTLAIFEKNMVKLQHLEWKAIKIQYGHLLPLNDSYLIGQMRKKLDYFKKVGGYTYSTQEKKKLVRGDDKWKEILHALKQIDCTYGIEKVGPILSAMLPHIDISQYKSPLAKQMFKLKNKKVAQMPQIQPQLQQPQLQQPQLQQHEPVEPINRDKAARFCYKNDDESYACGRDPNFVAMFQMQQHIIQKTTTYHYGITGLQKSVVTYEGSNNINIFDFTLPQYKDVFVKEKSMTQYCAEQRAKEKARMDACIKVQPVVVRDVLEDSCVLETYYQYSVEDLKGFNFSNETIKKIKAYKPKHEKQDDDLQVDNPEVKLEMVEFQTQTEIYSEDEEVEKNQEEDKDYEKQFLQLKSIGLSDNLIKEIIEKSQKNIEKQALVQAEVEAGNDAAQRSWLIKLAQQLNFQSIGSYRVDLEQTVDSLISSNKQFGIFIPKSRMLWGVKFLTEEFGYWVTASDYAGKIYLLFNRQQSFSEIEREINKLSFK